MSSSDRYGNGKGVSEYVQTHYDRLQDLPLGTEFIEQDLPEYVAEKGVQNLRAKNVIKKVGRDPTGPGNAPRAIWKVTDAAEHYLTEVFDSPRSYAGCLLPCGHHGFTNLRDSPLYECNLCGERHTREEIEESRNSDNPTA